MELTYEIPVLLWSNAVNSRMRLSNMITITRQKVDIQGSSNMTGTDWGVIKPHCAAAVRP
jgi:hypothetical protein